MDTIPPKLAAVMAAVLSGLPAGCSPDESRRLRDAVAASFAAIAAITPDPPRRAKTEAV